jgi:hypothetical protein
MGLTRMEPMGESERHRLQSREAENAGAHESIRCLNRAIIAKQLSVEAAQPARRGGRRLSELQLPTPSVKRGLTADPPTDGFAVANL